MFNKFLLATFSSLILLSLSVTPVFAQTTVVRVPANVEWVDSGIDVVFGNTIMLESKGVAITGPLSEYPEAISGPSGQITDCVDGAVPGMVCLLSGVPFGSLIGKINGGGSFLIGDSSSFVAGSSGRLYLAINDFETTYSDNHGGFTVLFP